MRQLIAAWFALACGAVALGQTPWRNYYPSFRDIASDGERYLAVGDTMFLSEDGEQWEELTSAPAASGAWSGAVSMNGQYFVLDVRGRVASSSDGLSWTVQDVDALLEIPPPEVRYQGIAEVDGKLLILSGRILVSDDGYSWSSVAEAQEYESFQKLATDGERIIVGGIKGSVGISTDSFAKRSRPMSATERPGGWSSIRRV